MSILDNLAVAVASEQTGIGLTNVQLRATPVPVSGPLTDAQLRAAALVTGYPSNIAVITPNDSADLATSMVIEVVTAGAVHFRTTGGQELTRTFSAGDVIKARVSKIWATGTTATTLWGYY